jgi:hypothetical protein
MAQLVGRLVRDYFSRLVLTASLVTLFGVHPALAQAVRPAPAPAPTNRLEPDESMVWGTIGFQGDLGGSVNVAGIGNINRTHFGIMATVDLRYSGVLSDQAGIGMAGFDRINTGGSRWTLPLLGGVYFKF